MRTFLNQITRQPVSVEGSVGLTRLPASPRSRPARRPDLAVGKDRSWLDVRRLAALDCGR